MKDQMLISLLYCHFHCTFCIYCPVFFCFLYTFHPYIFILYRVCFGYCIQYFVLFFISCFLFFLLDMNFYYRYLSFFRPFCFIRIFFFSQYLFFLYTIPAAKHKKNRQNGKTVCFMTSFLILSDFLCTISFFINRLPYAVGLPQIFRSSFVRVSFILPVR